MILLIPVCYQICSSIGLNNVFTNSQLSHLSQVSCRLFDIHFTVISIATSRCLKSQTNSGPVADLLQFIQPNNHYFGCMAWKVSILMLFYPVLRRFCNKMENYSVIILFTDQKIIFDIMYSIQYKYDYVNMTYILPGYHLNLAYFFHHTVNFIISTRNLMPWQTVTSKPNSAD